MDIIISANETMLYVMKHIPLEKNGEVDPEKFRKLLTGREKEKETADGQETL